LNKILLVVGFLLLISCAKHPDSADIFDTSIDLRLENISGEDLLNPDTDNSYNQNDIQLFNLMDGVEEYHFCGNCDHQQGYFFFKRDNNFVMRISPNFEIQKDGSDPITYIQWNETDRDTIQCHINRNDDGSYIFCIKVWYNNILVYDNDGERYFTIIKD
jgi:hypothetical protein